jgi:hypothetical protein
MNHRDELRILIVDDDADIGHNWVDILAHAERAGGSSG